MAKRNTFPHMAAFEALFSDMIKSVDAGSMAPAALSEGLVTDDQREECFHEKHSYRKAELLLGYIRRAISGQEDTQFLKFIKILRCTGHVTHAEQLGETSVYYSYRGNFANKITFFVVRYSTPDKCYRNEQQLRYAFCLSCF